jgi:hypothetical protein
VLRCALDSVPFFAQGLQNIFWIPLNFLSAYLPWGRRTVFLKGYGGGRSGRSRSGYGSSITKSKRCIFHRPGPDPQCLRVRRPSSRLFPTTSRLSDRTSPRPSWFYVRALTEVPRLPKLPPENLAIGRGGSKVITRC